MEKRDFLENLAFVFPGQASQYVGMGKDLYEEYPEIRELYQKANDILGFDIAKISFEGPLDLLTQTQYTQPAVFLHSVALWDLIRKEGINPGFVAGHSLGEYSALVASGALDFEQALFLVKNRSLFMQKACEENPGTMAAIMGLSTEDISTICQLASIVGVVQPANFNSSIQVAISGEKKGVEKAIELAKERKARRAVLLTVGGAFHSELMRPAQEKLTEVLGQTNIQSAQIPVVANVTARTVTESTKIKELLIEQITKPVLWHQSTSYMYQQGITIFVEVGPGKVLQGLLKRSFKDAEIFGVDTISDLANWVNTFKEKLALRE